MSLRAEELLLMHSLVFPLPVYSNPIAFISRNQVQLNHLAFSNSIVFDIPRKT